MTPISIKNPRGLTIWENSSAFESNQINNIWASIKMSNNKNNNMKELWKSNVTDTSVRTKSISNNKRVI